MFDTNTIVAAATLKGHSAIGMVRLSGKNAFDIAEKTFRSKHIKLCDCQSNTATFGLFHEGDRLIDECIFTVFRSPKSYTGEDMIEISHHGSPFIQQQILYALISCGARIATEGEFTKRAFLNGKLNLSQAEAIADVIAADNRIAHSLAMKQLRGGYNDKLKSLRADLLNLCGLLELELDFSEEDVTFANRSQLHAILLNVRTEIKQLLDSFALGNAFRKGYAVAIAGKPNSGKSTLLNTLLKDNRSIVSDIEGTTRDTVEEVLNLGGFDFRFIDTAGLRSNSDNVIENEGISRSYKAIEQANAVIYLFDLTKTDAESINNELEALKHNVNWDNKHLILAGNKCDMANCNYENLIPVSASKQQNINILIDKLISIVQQSNVENRTVITNARHFESMQEADKSTASALAAFESGMPTDIIATEVRTIIHHLGAITGEITTEEILGTIFSRFCIGK
ncbi:MAG: tRNA uridine-5-carboxymethylaminomethyl(34) synthesis GTPase MnmE [Bacteroidales bacterium]|jgi:tRNA modification GTPase|nr:tRNA uridine-5-carboxymethylaminomethyl(34) synthesis GTPase MnmE [Bacteroidales bacterium]